MGEVEDDGGDPLDDPFAGLRLDEAFVTSAVHREASAAERVRRPEPRPVPPVRGIRPRVRRRVRRMAPAHRLMVAAAVLFVGVVAGAVAVDRSRADEVASGPLWVGFEDVGGWVGVAPAANPSPSGSVERVREPVTAGTEGAHDFLARQPGSEEPVTWDPCRSVSFVLASEGLPEGAEDLLVDVLADVGRLTGLDLRLEGTTGEVPTSERPAVQPDRYGDRWAPVLVAWTNPRTVPDLAGDVVGMAGPLEVTAPSGRPTYVTGSVLLDQPDLERIEDDEGRASVEAVVRHELGHLVGMAHVDDMGELMFPVGDADRTAYGPGDQVGLARLGQGGCVPDL